MSLLESRPGKATEVDSRPSEPRPALALAWAGGFLVLCEVYVLARWVLGPTFRPTPTGPDPIPAGQIALLTGLQVAVPIGTVVCFWFWLVRP